MSLRLIMLMVAMLCISQSLPTWASVKLSALFSDNAVLQQKISVPVWGTAADGEKVTVKFQGQVARATARDGKWMVRLMPLKAGGPFTMTVTGENTIELKNILVGEVWVCSGQSNMELPLHPDYVVNAKQVSDASEDPMLRLFHVPVVAAAKPMSDVASKGWVECGPDTVVPFSAAGYFFCRDLRKALGVPVGLINSVRGGTIAQAWTGTECLESNPVTQPYMAQFPTKDGDVNGCGTLYNGMIYPLQPYGIRGVIWYQGESNTGDYRYRTLFPTLIECWRKAWGEGDFPFLFVQLAPFGQIPAEPVESGWAELREAQLLTSQTCPNTAMAVITDYGDSANIHPMQKEPVGARLALAARAIAYKENVAYQGPVYTSMQVRGSRAVISFANACDGLEARGGGLTGWTIAGEDHKFANARASIRGDKVIVSSPLVDHPIAVRYGWADCPVVNLFNKAGLPASPFRTDGTTTR